mmetsp:Transcript_15640/g.19067  ORF Transcript_15640/g.19067 Transcript_15640/m.19067 type:complete len:388 (-) Transcript_15640:321-1484(-)
MRLSSILFHAVSISLSTTINASSPKIAPSSSKNPLSTTSTKTRGGAYTPNALFAIGGAIHTITSPKALTTGQAKLFNVLSGGVAGTIASCITNPIEVVKTQLQSSSASVGSLANANGFRGVARRVFETEGLSGFFRGLPPTLVGIIPSRSVYFVAYESTKTSLAKLPGTPAGGPVNSLLSGFAAGLTSNTLTNPIWMVKTRMVLLADGLAGQKAYSGYRDAISTIFREEGVGGFYKGIAASYWGCTEGAIQFMLYEQIKTKLRVKNNRRRAALGLADTNELPALWTFLASASCKTVAAASTYPHEVARTRMREQARSGIFKYKGMWQTLGVIGKEEGRKGLYAGMGPHLLKAVPNAAIMFLTYETVNTWLRKCTVSDDCIEMKVAKN